MKINPFWFSYLHGFNTELGAVCNTIENTAPNPVFNRSDQAYFKEKDLELWRDAIACNNNPDYTITKDQVEAVYSEISDFLWVLEDLRAKFNSENPPEIYEGPSN